MSFCALPSEHLAAVRDRIKEHVHGGLYLDSDATASFARRLNTIIEMMREIEDENRVIARALTARHEARQRGGKPALTLVHDNDDGPTGGTAA